MSDPELEKFKDQKDMEKKIEELEENEKDAFEGIPDENLTQD